MHKCLLILLALNALFVTVNAGELYTSEYGNSFYIENVTMLSWYDAIQVCASRNMSLITLDTEEKYLEITKLRASLNVSYAWTSGQETENLKFVWTTTGNKFAYTKWSSGEPLRSGSTTQCIYIKVDGFASGLCRLPTGTICEENHIVKEKIRELDILKTQQTAELSKMKRYYENETAIQLEELKQSCRNETQELTKTNLEELHELKNDMKSYCEKETNSKLEELKKLHETEKQRDISVLKTDYEKKLNQLTLTNKIQEIEMLKSFHAKELRLQEEKYNFAQNSYDISNNRTCANKSNTVLINVHGNRN